MLIYRKAGKADLDTCTEILKASFAEYPFFNALIDDPKRKKKFYNVLMEIWMKVCLRNETVFIAESDKRVAAIVSLKAPTDKAPSLWDYTLAGGFRAVLAGGISNTMEFIRMVELSDSVCRRLPEPKWYCSMLAVESGYKGKGLGSRMLNECVLPYVRDNGGTVLTLNTNTEENRCFYLKNGFKEFDSMVMNMNGRQVGGWSYTIEIEDTKNAQKK